MLLYLLFFAAVAFYAVIAVCWKKVRIGRIPAIWGLAIGVSVLVLAASIGAWVDGGTVRSGYDPEADDSLLAMVDSVAGAYDAPDCGSEDEGEELFVEDMVEDDYSVSGCGEDGFAPGIDWSGCERFFMNAGGFRNVHFFINDGDRCIRVATSPADLLGTYAYVGTADGWHRFRQYSLVAEPLKMETTDLTGNPMTIKVPVIAGAHTKYKKVYGDDYVFILEDASRFDTGDESYAGVGRDAFWMAWKSCFGENWHLTTGSDGGVSAGNRQPESSGSISDYSVNKCKYCGGSGWCPKCGGRGYVDFMGDIQECPSCRGFRHCFNCGGSGIQL